MVPLKSSENQNWIWSDAGENAEETFRRAFPSIHQHIKSYEDRLRKREDQGRYWWELRSCAYYAVFEQPKIPIQRIAFHSRFSFDQAEMYINDAAIMLPSADLWMLTWLNSPLMWYYVFHKLPHKKDEAVAMDIVQVEALPIIQPTAEIRGEGETNAARLVTLTNER
jgi:hypothetical protein